jgi:hypothetical protein
MSTDTKEDPDNQVSPPAEAVKTEMAVDSNAGPSLASMKTDPGTKYEDEDLDSEDVDEEEVLLVSLEIEKEKEEAEEAAHPHEQPKEITAAPKLLQDALKKGVVTADDSEEEEEKARRQEKSRVTTVATKGEKMVMATDDSAAQEEKKGDDEPVDHHVHARVSTCVVAIQLIILIFHQRLLACFLSLKAFTGCPMTLEAIIHQNEHWVIFSRQISVGCCDARVSLLVTHLKYSHNHIITSFVNTGEPT